MKFITTLLVLFLAFVAKSGTPLLSDSLNMDCDTIWFKNGKVKVVSILSEDENEIVFTDCPPSKSEYVIAKSQTKISPTDSIKLDRIPLICDTVFLENGEYFLARVIEDSPKRVQYKECCKQCETIYELRPSEVDRVGAGRELTPEEKNKIETEQRKRTARNGAIIGGSAVALGGIIAVLGVVLIALLIIALFALAG